MAAGAEIRGFADHRPLAEPPAGDAPTRQTVERRRRRTDPLKTTSGKLNFGLSAELYAAAERLRRCYEALEQAAAVPCLPLERIGGSGRGREPLGGVWLPWDGAFQRWQAAAGSHMIPWRLGDEDRAVSYRVLTELLVVYGMSGRDVERVLPGFRREWIGPALRWALADFAQRTGER